MEAEIAPSGVKTRRPRMMSSATYAAGSGGGTRRLVAAVLPQNRAMLQVFEKHGFQLHYSVEQQVVQAQLGL